MKSLISTIVLVLLSFHFAFSQDTTFTKNDFDSAKIYYKMKDVPDFIKQRLYQEEGDVMRIADAGKKYSAGCTGGDPHERLICFVEMHNRYIFFYEHGGYAWGTHCFIFNVNEKKVDNVLSLHIGGVVKSNPSYKDLETSLLKGDYYVRKN